MRKLKPVGVIAAAGAVIAATASTLNRHEAVAGRWGDFWIGFAIGLALVLLAAAVVLMIRRAKDQGSNGSRP
jgi:cytochrome bd-type quinol oxidase subunit 2